MVSHDCKQEEQILRIARDVSGLSAKLEAFIDSITGLVAEIRLMIRGEANKIDQHIKEGEQPGGYRERLVILEQEVSALKKAEWARLIVASLIGGLVANATPEIFSMLMKLCFRGL